MTIGGVISNSSVKLEFGYVCWQMGANACILLVLYKKVIQYTYRHYLNKFADMPPAVFCCSHKKSPVGLPNVRIIPPHSNKNGSPVCLPGCLAVCVGVIETCFVLPVSLICLNVQWPIINAMSRRWRQPIISGPEGTLTTNQIWNPHSNLCFKAPAQPIGTGSGT